MLPVHILSGAQQLLKEMVSRLGLEPRALALKGLLNALRLIVNESDG